MTATASRERPPARRLVVLGASNVARSFSTLVQVARGTWREPLEVLAALGHGRSLGMTSYVLGRGLPGILQCGLWPALARRAALPAVGLMTDIGNDVLYGVPVHRIAAWVDDCLGRLRDACERVLVTQLPLDSLDTLRPARFHLFRTLFFPGSSLTFAQAKLAARQLSECVAHSARRHAARLLQPRSEWYGADPIHVRRSRFAAVWSEALRCVEQQGSAVDPARVPLPLWWQLHTLRPEQRTLWGITQQRPQPAARLADGTSISLY